MLKCLSCGYVKPGYPDVNKVSQARDYYEPCPSCDDVIANMDVVEVVESGKVVWRDPLWAKDEANLVREIDNLSKKDHIRKRGRT